MSRRGRRGNAEGSIYQRRDGRWVAQLQIGYDANGAPRFRHRYATTRREADDRLVEMKAARLGGLLDDDEGLTVAGLLERWLESKVRDLRPSTLLSYRSTARLYISPLIGRLRLERLRPLDLERMVAGLLEAGHSQHIAAYSLRIIKSALKQAVRWQLVARNAAEAIRPPRVPKNELTVWTGAEAKRFLEVTAPHRLHGLFVLALLTGMRRGELLGLGWDDVDFERTRLTVRRNLVYTPGLLELSKPKTAGSHRTVSLSPGVIEALHHHRQRQTLEREALGAAYGDCGLVFASEVGTPTHPRNLERVFFNHLESSGVRRIRFHDLRHTAASLMILRGVPPKLVSKLLGHASVAFTLQVYVHVFEEQEEGAALDLNDLDR